MLQSTHSLARLMLLLKQSHNSVHCDHPDVRQVCAALEAASRQTAHGSTRCAACRFLEQIINTPSQTLEVDADFMDDLQQALIDRLSDRLPAVRATAARALARMADPGEVSTVTQRGHGRARGRQQALLDRLVDCPQAKRPRTL